MTAVTLTVNVNTTRGSTEVSCSNGIVRIGSATNCDVHLAEPAVARMHAIVEAESADVVYVINMGDGVQLNGKRVALKERVYPGDVIEVGQSAAKITFLAAKSTPLAPAAKVVREVEKALCIEREGGYLHGLAWCGKAIGPQDRYIPGIDRFVQNVVAARTRNRACPACCNAIKSALDTAATPVEERAKVA